MRLTFVVPVRNDAANLRRCLISIGRNQRVIVADNGSTDDSRAVAHAFGADVLLLPDVRVSTLRNRAVAAAVDSDAIAFVDADHELGPEWIPTARELLADGSIGAVGASYTTPPNATWVQTMYGHLRGHTVGQQATRWLGSGNLAIRRKVFDALGGFDESLQTCEDVDLCERLYRFGWRLIADERLRSIHYGDPRTLRAIVNGERWRGRDNLRVSLRHLFA